VPGGHLPGRCARSDAEARGAVLPGWRAGKAAHENRALRAPGGNSPAGAGHRARSPPGLGRDRFYDVNAHSNFVTDAERLLGFNPYARVVDVVEERIAELGRTRSPYAKILEAK
jgi:hypothetical protein